ncbi:MAG: sigma-70 family RNA polymerase sigma factor [Phenylobacterium sp.]|uniref:RNA polymerase sigma factor n=1 Tax=Phenylobacterium sp. TaxID=1871053 RepID=UPI001A279624|nr:hypothetical protein [Phenylobacterium sp.]MBJ7410400.1 sigma-70 family RNA polymerase sigma factor [Phenylobacterium sp.]
MALPPTELRARAALSEDDPRHLGAEALVFFIRRADQAGHRSLCDALFRILIDRCNVYFRGKIRGLMPDEREDVQQAVLARLVELLFAGDDRGDFAQVRFWSLLDARTTTEIMKVRTRQRRAVSLDDPLPGEGDGSALGQLEAPQLSPEALAELSDVLGKLDPQLRTVFLMRHQLGMAIGKERREDEDPADPSIALHFQVSARTVGKWLAKAEAALETFRKA